MKTLTVMQFEDIYKTISINISGCKLNNEQ